MKTLAFLVVLALQTTAIYSQEYQIATDNSEVSITGTSSIHDWEADVTNFDGSAQFATEDGILKSVNGLSFTAVVKSIESGKGGMNSKIYDALKEKKHKTITFKAEEISSISEGTITANGALTIAGVTRDVEFTAAYEILNDGSIKVQGSAPLAMRDFDVDPPKAMFGTIKAGNEIVVHFNTLFTAATNS